MFGKKPANRLLVPALAAICLSASPAQAARVLLMVDSESTEITTLQTALTNAGNVVTKANPEYAYSQVPSRADFDVVVHMNGSTFDRAMPISTQEGLVQFVRAGGGFVGAQWLGLEEAVGTQVNMTDLVLAGSLDTYIDGCAPCNLDVVSGQEAHPVLAGIPTTSVVDRGFWDGSQKTFAVNPPTVLMRIRDVNGPVDAVLVRDVGQGRVVNLTAAVNYDTGGHGLVLTRHQHVTQLYVNAVAWAGSAAPANSAPTAVIAAQAAVHAGQDVILDGSQSVDPDSNPLTYHWTLTRPSGSGAMLSSSSAVMPTFTADIPGDYGVQLIVNDGTVDSAPVNATVSSNNGSPVADAGADQLLVASGTVAKLNADGSSDPDGDALSYAWELVTRPPGSTAVLDLSTSATPQFTADMNGTYVATLQVTDAFGANSGDSVTVSFNNLAPVANAGADRVVGMGGTVVANGSATDANGDPLTCRWSLSSVPEGSFASLTNATTFAPSFVADKVGTYVLQLVANDGFVDSAGDTAIVEVVSENRQDAAAQTIQELIGYVNGLSNADSQGHKVFKHRGARRVLVHDLMAARRMMGNGKYRPAMKLLANHEKRAMDGCTIKGRADRNDLIRTCAEQSKAYALLNEAVAYLAEMPGRAPRLDRNRRVGSHHHHHHRRSRR